MQTPLSRWLDSLRDERFHSIQLLVAKRLHIFLFSRRSRFLRDGEHLAGGNQSTLFLHPPDNLHHRIRTGGVKTDVKYLPLTFLLANRKYDPPDLLLSIGFPEYRRGHPAGFPEHLRKVGTVGETTFRSNFRNTVICVGQDLLGILYPDLCQILNRGLAEILIEYADTVSFSDEGTVRDILKADLLREMIIDIGHHPADSVRTVVC